MSYVAVSPLLKVTLHRLSSVVDAASTALNDEFRMLAATLESIAAAIDREERFPLGESSVMRWVENLEDEVGALSDVIDELEVARMKNNQVTLSMSHFNPFSSNSNFTQQVYHIRQNLDDVEMLFRQLPHDDLGDANYHTSMSVNRAHYRKGIVGRGSDENAVIDLVLQCDDAAQHRVSVIPIVGIFGVGKTELAGLVFNNQEIIHNFYPRIWLDLNVLEEQCRRCEGDIMGIEEIKELQTSSQNTRFFIVLDGLEDNKLHLSLARKLVDMVGSGSNGSVILVTTYSRRAASLIANTPAYHLQPLSLDASHLLLTTLSGGYGKARPEMESMSRDFAELCHGVPLHLKIVGSILSEKYSYPEWKYLLSELKKVGYLEPISSYTEYNYRLQAYLPLFIRLLWLQKTCYQLSIESLICVWMALGSLYSDDPTKQPEIIAREYLTAFVHSPLCPYVEYAPGGVVRLLNFNDAVFDYLTSIQRMQWFVQHGTSSEEPDRSCRYIIWNKDCLPLLSYKTKVRLFFLCIREASPELVRGIISAFKLLHVLSFGGCDVESLPNSIGQLKHLRYLDVGRNFRMKSLPDSICDLWHLQSLFLHGCSQLQVLPANIGRLQNLRYLTLATIQKSLP